jgi:hypothetical protein
MEQIWLMLNSTNLAETDATDLAHFCSLCLMSSGSFKDLTHFTVIDLESFFFVFICLNIIAE